jgi:hypothetical protein
MPEPTQKQIAAKYRDDLTYYKKTHVFPAVRFWLERALFVGGIVVGVGFHRFGGRAEFFNTGANFGEPLAFCEGLRSVPSSGATTDMLSRSFPSIKTKAALQSSTPVLETLKGAGNRRTGHGARRISPNLRSLPMPHTPRSTASISIESIARVCSATMA